MRRSTIFDLDQTLVDSSCSESLRKARNWSSVYEKIRSFTFYDGMQEVLQKLVEKDIEICIVTTSPSTYAKKVLEYFNIPYKHLIAYHDVTNRKPHPESFFKMIKLLGCSCDAIMSFGDRAIDVEASKAAGIISVGCTWGTAELELLRNSHPDHLINQPSEILDLLL